MQTNIKPLFHFPKYFKKTTPKIVSFKIKTKRIFHSRRVQPKSKTLKKKQKKYKANQQNWVNSKTTQ